MKYLKYTLLLIILLTFVSVHAETCTYEENEKQLESLDLSTFKYKYIKKKVVPIVYPPHDEVYKDVITPTIKPLDKYYIALSRDYTKYDVSEDIITPLAGGVYVLKIYQIGCFDGIKSYEIFVPYFNPKSDNVWDDYSLTSTHSNTVVLIITLLLLAITTTLLLKYVIKNVKEY